MNDNCFVAIPGNDKGKRIGIAVYQEPGYYVTDYDNHETIEQCKDHVRLINESRGVSAEIEEAAFVGSMFGWGVPGAQAAVEYFETRRAEEKSASRKL